MAGKVALVTGAGSGLGAAITTAFLEAGGSVVGADIDESGFAHFAAWGRRFRGRRTDVTVESDLEAAVATAVEEFGALDAAFNVAGVSRGKPLIDLDEALWDFNVDRVLKGVFLSVKHEARAMRDLGGGAIVNMSSLNARVPMHTGGAYASAKAGVEMLTRTAALELAPCAIRVNSVLPGLIDTPLTQRRLTNGPLMEEWLPRIPMRRPGRPEEVALACLFLAGEDASYITGSSLVVDGGWELTGYPDLSRHT
ncbi:SDR family NAD(P)-dependent oxidoreductase [Streptomyces bobili]|uniref:SDR family NAD(P)-dependent oxidoreductase n=1 Tax=Streptomyces bobili TaxID=67280 RepID=UPI00365F1EAB